MSGSSRSPRLLSRLVRPMGNGIAPSGRGKGRLCIINYHRILGSPDPLLASEPDIATFRWQMQLLAECFNVMPLHNAVQALSDERMPPRAVCITFDDGYRSIHDHALPILKEFDLPATVFVTTGYAAEDNMWNDRILEAVRKLPGNQLNLSEDQLGVFSLQSPAERQRTAQKLTESAKYLSPEERLCLARKLEEMSGNPHFPNVMLTPEMVINLARHGIEIGGHTITHPILAVLDDASARHEIIENKRQLEALINKPVRYFAYPNGKAGIDFNESHVAMVKEAGYTAAFTTSIGAATRMDDPYRLPRCRPWDATPFMFSARLLYWLAGKRT